MTSQHDALFAQYTQSWENKDLPQFLACLTDDIIITECYGATYTSKTEAQNGSSIGQRLLKTRW